MAAQAASQSEKYRWGSVPIGGGGYVTGIAIHPAEPDLVYVRTDVGGAYRWDPDGERWIPLLDMYGRDRAAYYNVDAIAVDPRNPDVVYAAVGRTVGGLSAVLRSENRGQSWQETNIQVGIYGNADFRWAAPRLAIDPASGAILFGTRDRGLWRSNDGFNFHSVDTFPAVGMGSGDVRDGVDAVGLTFVAWDVSAGTGADGATKRIYVGVFGDDRPGPAQGGIYVSDDGGGSWSRIPGSPLKPVQGVVDASGRLYASHTQGVVRCTPDACAEIAPRPGEYAGVSVDPNRPGLVMVSERIRASANPFYLSTDGGNTWRRIEVPVRNRTPEPPWWPDTFFASATATLTLDPHYPGRVWLTDWFGVWRTEDVFAAETKWRSYEQGHEEVVVHTLRGLPTGSPLLSGVADVAGFRHAEGLDRFPTRGERLPSDRSAGGVQDINWIAFYEPDPRYVYAVGNIRSQPVGRAFRSTDYGVTWTVIDPARIPTLPDDVRGGRIAVSSADPDRIVWLPLSMPPFFSSDGGRSWQPTQGAAAVVPDVWLPSSFLASNTTGTEMFYIYSPGTGFLRSRDGVNFEAVPNNGLPRTSARYTFVHAAPGIEGELWVSMDQEGLYRSADFGSTFERVSAVQQAFLFDFGKGRPESGIPAAYIYGRANGDAAEGVYRSDDGGETWVRISSADVLFGAGPKVLAGDRQVFGRVYIGTGGRGIFVGERVAAYAELSIGSAEVRVTLDEADYDVVLPFGTDRMPPVEVRFNPEALELAAGPGAPGADQSGSGSAVGDASGGGPRLNVTPSEAVPGTVLIELVDSGGAVLHRATVHVRTADRPDVRVNLGGRPVDTRETPTLWGKVPLAIEVDGPSSMLRQVEAALIPIRGGDPVREERRVVLQSGPGTAPPDSAVVDTERFEDGAYDLEVTVETVLGTNVNVVQRLLLDNWSVVEDELLPPQQSGWFGVVKQRKTVAESSGWQEVGGNAGDFSGDTNRLAPLAGAVDPYLVWPAERLARFEIIAFTAQPTGAPPDVAAGATADGVIERILVAASRDQNQWVELPFALEPVETSAGGWTKLRVHGEVPDGVSPKFFRLLYRTGSEAGGQAGEGTATIPIQFGRVQLTLRAH